MEDATLIDLVRKGSEDAVVELFHRYWPSAWQWASVTGDRALADHAAQEAIHRAFRSLDRFDAERPFGSWLKRIIVNQAIDELRRERRAHAIPEPSCADPGDELGGLDAIVAAVAQLPVQRRLVIVLFYWLDFGIEEIAALLAVPPGTVSSRLSRARTDLRALLEEENVF